MCTFLIALLCCNNYAQANNNYDMKCRCEKERKKIIKQLKKILKFRASFNNDQLINENQTYV